MKVSPNRGIIQLVAQPFHHHLFDPLRPPIPSRRQVHAPMADQGSPDVMGGDRSEIAAPAERGYGLP